MFLTFVHQKTNTIQFGIMINYCNIYNPWKLTGIWAWARNISKKLLALLMLLIGTRVNTLTHLNVTNTFITENECSFTFDEVLKHSRPNYCRKPLVFRAYPECPSLCLVATLLKYLQVRLSRSSDPRIFIATLPPYREEFKWHHC